MLPHTDTLQPHAMIQKNSQASPFLYAAHCIVPRGKILALFGIPRWRSTALVFDPIDAKEVIEVTVRRRYAPLNMCCAHLHVSLYSSPHPE